MPEVFISDGFFFACYTYYKQLTLFILIQIFQMSHPDKAGNCY